jgi:DNA-directed RNA polymerase specialized sigma24 family protein
MAKVYHRKLLILPESKNFGDLNINLSEEEKSAYDFGDDNRQTDEMVSAIQADILLLEVLFNLDDRQKVIFLYQILREAGYGLNHGDCAQTLSISRQKYMILLKEIKKKASKVLQSSEE